MSDTDVGSGALAWVKFRAPPPSVHTLDVIFPDGGPVVTGVPIGSGPAPSASQVGPGVQAAAPANFAYPASSTDTTGLTLPVENLNTIVGNSSGSDSEAAGRSTITLNADVLFRFDKSNLTPVARGILQNVAARIKSGATGTVSVIGYTDSIGTDAVNIPLSQARAQSVVAALKPLVGAAPVSFQASGRGSADPVAPNTKPNGADNPAGRALNRRVPIAYAVKAPTQPAAPPASVPSSAPQTAAATRTATLKAQGDYLSTYSITAERLFRTGNLAVLEFSATCQNRHQQRRVRWRVRPYRHPDRAADPRIDRRLSRRGSRTRLGQRHLPRGSGDGNRIHTALQHRRSAAHFRRRGVHVARNDTAAVDLLPRPAGIRDVAQDRPSRRPDDLRDAPVRHAAPPGG